MCLITTQRSMNFYEFISILGLKLLEWSNIMITKQALFKKGESEMSTELTKFLVDNFVASMEPGVSKVWGYTSPYPLYLTALNHRFTQPNL